MARLRQPAQPKAGDVVLAVFSPSSVRPPKTKKQFESKRNLNLENVRQQLTEDSRRALGIGFDDMNIKIALDGSPPTWFRPYFPSSQSLPPIDSVTTFSSHLYEQSFSKLGSWKHLPSWRTDFGTGRIEKLFAAVIDKLISEFIGWSYSRSYQAHEGSVVIHLNIWLQCLLGPYLNCVLSRLTGAGLIHGGLHRVQKWRDLAMTRLADLRITELFDIVVDWDNSAPAIDDLKTFVSSSATRTYLTLDFASVLTQRLLHPGASTIEILQIYISIIKAFRQMDPKGVILEKVARRIRAYLRHRDDTIRVVVAGLLADVPDNVVSDDPDLLSELAVELQHSSLDQDGNDEGLDWNDMNWNPDPIDAAPDYMKSKSTDVVGSLISLLESKDVFVKELQTMLAERLLKNKTDFDQEISVVEHLKKRFGDSTLQGCEVMLRDVLDSKKLDQVIRQDRSMTQSDAAQNTTQFHTKILSRLFWPSLQEQTFNIPSPVRQQQEDYEKGFESLKQSRKLTWLNAVGHVEVELELADRVFRAEVLPWQASVIYAFQAPTHPDSVAADHSDVSKPVSKALSSLATELDMTLPLVRSACMFWSAKRVLYETSRDVFTVLENLVKEPSKSSSSEDAGVSNDATASSADAISTAAAEAAAAQAVRDAEEAERKQKMAMYHQFIISMLTNQGSMPLPRIAMMLGIVVPGGFPFTNEELREFMAGMVRDGTLELGGGGAYKVKT